MQIEIINNNNILQTWYRNIARPAWLHYNHCVCPSARPIYFPYISSGTVYLGDNCIQIFHLGRYIVGYTVGNLVLWRRVSGAVKRDFRTYIRRYTSPNENFEYGYPHSNALLTFSLQKTVKMYFVAHIRPATPAA